jgi:hypothetical protein
MSWDDAFTLLFALGMIQSIRSKNQVHSKRIEAEVESRGGKEVSTDVWEYIQRTQGIWRRDARTFDALNAPNTEGST